MLPSIPPINLFFLAVIAALTVALIASIVIEIARPRPNSAASDHTDDPDLFLFENRILVDASPKARKLLRLSSKNQSEWDALVNMLAGKFADLDAVLQGELRSGLFYATTWEEGSFVELEQWDDMVRVSLHESGAARDAPHPLAIQAMEDELRTLRQISENAPQLMWKENNANAVTWANQAYLDLADKAAPNGRAWPPRRLFLAPDTPGIAGTAMRRSITVNQHDHPLWFDLVSLPQHSETIYFATTAGSAVAAEKQAKKFVQTLTKTFAQLSIGLAIFDKQRHLVMFNPALLDLTGLPVGFLSSRPLVRSVLDRLRDRNMLPEPTNYKSWREQVSALEMAAEAGTYCENWYLPGGQTYRVTGRPHPDGAIAFTFEDITAEISLTRHFRSKLETSQNVIEAMDEAIAVFSAAGTLQMNNAAYAAFWGQSADGLGEVTLYDEVAQWQDRTAPSPFWQELRSHSGTNRPRGSIQETLRMADGRPATCRFVPLAGGSVMVALRILADKSEPDGHGVDLGDVPVLTPKRA